MATRKDNDFLNGVPELLLLRLLARQPMHGYELVQGIRLSTGGVLAFGEGCIYPVLHRLEADGVLLGKRETVNGRSRVVYRLTAAGRKRLGEATGRWEAVAGAIARVLQEGAKMHRPWHDRLDVEMKRRGVPAKFRRRVLAEASDHADDLKEGGMDMAEVEARMGEPADVAATAADQHRRTTWTRRHPLLVFGLLPVPLFVIGSISLTILLELAFAGVGWLFGASEEDLPRWSAVGFAYTVCWVLRFVPFTLLAWFFTRRFVRSGVHWGWYAAALTQVLFLAVTFVLNIKYSDTPGESLMQVAFLWLPSLTADGWVWPMWWLLSWSHLFQLLVPAGLAWGLVTLAKRRQMALAA